MTIATCKIAFAVLILTVAAVVSSSAQTFTTLYNFDGSKGGGPVMPLIQGRDGKLWGTLNGGGSYFGGTVYEISKDGVFQAKYEFCSLQNCTDGQTPFGVLLGTDGNFYGTTEWGGASNSGSIFRLTSFGALTTLYSFSCDANRICANGIAPEEPLVEGADGNFYGTTLARGSDGATIGGELGGLDYNGTVFEISPQGTLTTLHRFQGPDGSEPDSILTVGADGELFGTTIYGGAGTGAIFRMKQDGTDFMVLDTQIAQPEGLILGGDGNLYGSDSGLPDPGTIFQITPDGTVTTLHTFCPEQRACDTPQGAFPSGSLIQATDGNFYGTTLYGGDFSCARDIGCGTLFRMTPQGTLTTLHNFENQDHRSSQAGGLLQGTDGKIYGTTLFGGTGNNGTVFQLDLGLGPFVAFVRPFGNVSQSIEILGQGFTGATSVSLNGTPASFRVVSDTFIEATVPAGATTGYVTVTTPGGTLTSNVPFRVLP
jgi:uncharacterized repeat protein (TIGR03803 family)